MQRLRSGLRRRKIVARHKVRRSKITARQAKDIRYGIAAGELAYSFKAKGDNEGAQRVMVCASRASKATYLAAVHTLAKRLSCDN